ncbi:hypothetical protein BT93_B3161 [Corymbia citriodora subsp. variegata]|nr:hypothetical protein BT93_B3161 [Corymbia citriodora subsp. variegata]
MFVLTKRIKHHRQPLGRKLLILLITSALAFLFYLSFSISASKLVRPSLHPDSLSVAVTTAAAQSPRAQNSSPRSQPQSPFANLTSPVPTPAFSNVDAPSPPKKERNFGPYHDRVSFAADFQEMMRSFKIYVYPDAYNSSSSASSSPFANIFLPHVDPFNPKLGNYFSEHMFKISLLRSSLVTSNPQQAQFFFMPFSINNMRNDPRVRHEGKIADFVAGYAARIGREFGFWNASGGADHFYAHCHSVGRDAASKHRDLLNNAVQVTCSSSYFQRSYVAHKDVALPQVWPRRDEQVLTPPSERHRLVFFSGRIQNSRIRQELIDTYENDSSMGIFSKSPFPYEEGFKGSRYCLHVKGYEVNTARICDAIHYGCVPVILSNYYDLPFSNILDWSKFSVIISHGEISSLKERLLAIPREIYLSKYHNLCQIRKHFMWHTTPRGYDSFYMTAYQLWVRRSVHRLLH